MSFPQYLLVALLSYLIGSFSFGIFISASKGQDVREKGSKSSGATNVSRVLGFGFGLLTFLGDFAKASLAIWIGQALGGMHGMLTAGLYAVIGHNWPIYYKFKGGKGIVCSVAVIAWVVPTVPLTGLIIGLISLLIIYLTRYVSVGSLSFLAISAVWVLITMSFHPYGIWSLILLGLGVYQHRTNIKRLMDGNENKIGAKKKAE